jgi:hypothetical protein
VEWGWATHVPLNPCLAVLSRILRFLVLGCVERMIRKDGVWYLKEGQSDNVTDKVLLNESLKFLACMCDLEVHSTGLALLGHYHSVRSITCEAIRGHHITTPPCYSEPQRAVSHAVTEISYHIR